VTLELALPLIVLLLLLEAFFSGSEIALVSVDKLDIRARRAEGGRSVRMLARFLEEPERILTTTLIGTNVCVVSNATVLGLALVDVLGSGVPENVSHLATVAILSPLVLLFGELVPKSVAHRYSRVLAPVVIHPLTWLSYAFFPMVLLVRGMTAGLLRLLGEETGVAVSRDELRLILDLGEGEEIEEEERKIISRIFDFPEVTAKEVMVPLIDIKGIEEGATLDDAARIFAQSGHTRLPIFHERVDDIVGVLHAMDVLCAEDRDQLVSGLKRPLTYVPPTQKVESLMEELQQNRHGIAIVVDEYGGAEGMITVEDILEEIVGEIEDEFDDPGREIRKRGEREYLVSARTEVDRLNEELAVRIPEGDYETLAGFLLERFGRIPVRGDSAETDAALFRVVSASDRVIEEIQVLLKGPDDPGAD
jgi:CBS domain containing-hemolysin-like protein